MLFPKHEKLSFSQARETIQPNVIKFRQFDKETHHFDYKLI